MEKGGDSKVHASQLKHRLQERLHRPSWAYGNYEKNAVFARASTWSKVETLIIICEIETEITFPFMMRIGRFIR